MKLVRDKIPEIIKENNEKPITHIASDEEYWKFLKEKFGEEFKEFLEKENEEEFADVLEVLDAIKKFKNLNEREIEKLKKKKFNERGGFDKRIILDGVE